MRITLSAPSGKLCYSGRLVASKSESNRVLIMQFLSGNSFALHNLSDSDDTRVLAVALDQIRNAPQKQALIDVGAAGTTFRFLTALLAFYEGNWQLTGSARMKERPIGILAEALRNMGAQLTYLEKEGYPPLQIRGGIIRGGELTLDAGVSSQFVSALLLIAPYLENGLKLRFSRLPVSAPYIAMTIALMRHFGAEVQDSDPLSTEVKPVPYSFSQTFEAEADWSAASYWYAFTAFSPAGSEVFLRGLRKESLQGDAVVAHIFRAFGVETKFTAYGVRLHRREKELFPAHFTFDFTDCPDLAQTLACVCAAGGVPAHLTGLKTLRIKETDRIAALCSELDLFGVKTVATADTLEIHPPVHLLIPERALRTYHDHRMAMAFSVFALCGIRLSIENPAVVRKSYPSFWEELQAAGFIVEYGD